MNDTATIKKLNHLSVGDRVLLKRDSLHREGWIEAHVTHVTRTQITVNGIVFRIDKDRPRFAHHRSGAARGNRAVYYSHVQSFDQSVLDAQEAAREAELAKVDQDNRCNAAMKRLHEALRLQTGASKDHAILRVEALVRDLDY
jgi:hypothetical protein